MGCLTKEVYHMRSFVRNLYTNLKSHLHSIPWRHVVVFDVSHSPLSSMCGVENRSNESPAPDKVQAWKTQFEEFLSQNEKSRNLPKRIRSLCSEIKSGAELSSFIFLLVCDSQPTPDVLETVKGPINLLREFTTRLEK